MTSRRPSVSEAATVEAVEATNVRLATDAEAVAEAAVVEDKTTSSNLTDL